MFNDNIFMLNNSNFNYLSDLLFENLLTLYSYDDIVSSYITSYKNDKYTGQLNITILIKDDANIYFYKRILKQINSLFSNVDISPILFCVDYENEYNPDVNKSSSIIRIEELLKSEILFDKNSTLTSIKNKFINKEFIYKFDIIEFQPSISENVAFKLYRKLQ